MPWTLKKLEVVFCNIWVILRINGTMNRFKQFDFIAKESLWFIVNFYNFSPKLLFLPGKSQFLEPAIARAVFCLKIEN